MTSTEISSIISKVTACTQQIQGSLVEMGYCSHEITKFFASNVFASRSALDSAKNVKSQLRTEIKTFLKQYQQSNDSMRIGLVTLLSRLEIEKGKIEQYAHQLNQCENFASKQAHQRGELIKECLRKKIAHSAFMKHPEERTQSAQGSLKRPYILEKERMELLAKVQLFRNIMECKNDDKSDQMSIFQRLLALESSG